MGHDEPGEVNRSFFLLVTGIGDFVADSVKPTL